jgi:hypothetical protein
MVNHQSTWWGEITRWAAASLSSSNLRAFNSLRISILRAFNSLRISSYSSGKPKNKNVIYRNVEGIHKTEADGRLQASLGSLEFNFHAKNNIPLGVRFSPWDLMVTCPFRWFSVP